MRHVGLRFLFHSTYFQVTVPEGEARDVIHKWASGWFRLKDQRHLNGDGWAVDLHAVVGMHVMDLAPQGAVAGAYHNAPIGARSGIIG